jgi:hypothetical protein
VGYLRYKVDLGEGKTQQMRVDSWINSVGLAQKIQVFQASEKKMQGLPPKIVFLGGRHLAVGC